MGFDLNANMESESASDTTVEKCKLEIVDYDLAVNDDNVEYISIQIREIGDKFKFEARQYLKKKENGEYKSTLWAGFEGSDGRVPPSLLWEIKEAIKTKLGDEKYEERKVKAGGVNKKFFLKAQFEFEVKVIELKTKTVYILNTEAQKIKDEEYRNSQKPKKVDNTEIVEEAIDTSDLPF